MEDHTEPAPADVKTAIVLLDIEKQSFVYITQPERASFFASPRFSAKGDAICYVTWSHPSMPWSSSYCHVKSVSKDLEFGKAVVVAGGADESISQPRWERDGNKLVFLSDRSGYYELYSWDNSKKRAAELVLKEPTGSDVGGALVSSSAYDSSLIFRVGPDWLLGQSTHCSLGSSQWISIAREGDLRLINLDKQESSIIKTPFSSISVMRRIDSDRIAIIGASATSVDELVIFRLSDGTLESVKKSSAVEVQIESISVAKSIEFPAKDGTTSHGYYYPPTNKDYVGEASTLPPVRLVYFVSVGGKTDAFLDAQLIVHCHGGPTSAAKSSLNLGIQYFTNRGFAYVDVNYGGSTGYGRAFRKRLDGEWGVVDVDDTISAVEYLTTAKLVDPKRVSIVGGSAGGFTVLAALCDSDVFSAGVSLYGVSDLALLAGETHKFESEYLFGLVGGTPDQVPDVRALSSRFLPHFIDAECALQIYKSRSPINKADQIKAPLLLLQGRDDKVVPLEQATKMKDSIEKNGGDCELIIYDGEGHGFRRADSKKSALESELAWYRNCFGIVGGN